MGTEPLWDRRDEQIRLVAQRPPGGIRQGSTQPLGCSPDLVISLARLTDTEDRAALIAVDQIAKHADDGWHNC